ncbi:hypothetical protein RYX36_020074, partial [Vicia faba]
SSINHTIAPSLSYSYSHPFSHNPSCSLTRNSTENFEFSTSKDDHIWNCGEGTNGSVHSRFKPIGDGVVGLSNHGGGTDISLFMQQGNNSQYKTTSSENHSFFPSELPARPRFEAHSGDSRGNNSENLRVFEGLDGGKMRNISRPERIVWDIVSESVLIVSLITQEFTGEVMASTQEYLKNLIENKKEELVSLQNRLEKRFDLTKDNLSKGNKVQLEILLAIKMGMSSFLYGNLQLSEMVEIFLYRRCRNVTCKSLLPVDDCDWPSLKGPSGTSEMQFHCIGCGHASEMFGFVKDVFMCCAKDWGHETLLKELDCVRRIFMGSEDHKGKELHFKTDDLLLKLQTKIVSPSDACNYIMQFSTTRRT